MLDWIVLTGQEFLQLSIFTLSFSNLRSENLAMNQKNVIIYTDGACSGNPGPGGYGVVLSHEGQQTELSQGFRWTTNNRMEILAAIVGLEAIQLPSQVQIYSDSKYLVDAMTKGWVNRWQANDWMRNKKEQASNIDLWQRLLPLCQQHQVEFLWVKGHAGHQWNEHCDRLAREALDAPQLLTDDGYKKLT